MYDELVRCLRHCVDAPEHRGCAGECRFGKEHPLNYGCIPAMLSEAADAIEELRGALLLMVLQYCATDDGVLYHSYMSAGENAFAVLGLENGQQADPLWNMLLNQKPPKEE